MPRTLAALLLLCAVLLAACGGDDAPEELPNLPSTLVTATAVATEGNADDKPTAAPTPEPDEISVANEPFSVETPDGVVLHGHAYTPDGPKRQALVIVAPVEQSIWAESTGAFTSEGVAVFTFDPQGFGETGGDEDAMALKDDVALVTRFVMSREYPLVYLMGVGTEGGEAAADAATELGTVTGLLTYGFAVNGANSYELSIAADASWAGEDVLADPNVRDMVLTFVLGAN